MGMLVLIIIKGLIIFGGVALVISVLMAIFSFILGIIKIFITGVTVGDQVYNLPMRIKMIGVKKALQLDNSSSHQTSAKKTNPIVSLFQLIVFYFYITSIPALITLLVGAILLPFSILGAISSDDSFSSEMLNYFSKWFSIVWNVFKYCALLGWMKD